MYNKLVVIFLLALFGEGLYAVQINFTAGNPALAADVNANFTELYNAKWTLTGADLSYSGGNVGIGLTTPNRKLVVTTGSTRHDVAGSGALFTSDSTNAGTGGVLIGSDNNVGFIAGVNGTGTATNHLVLNQNGGNVGIGNGTPGAKLSLTQTAGTSADGIRIVNGSVTTNFYSDAGGTIHLNNSAAAALVLNDTGGNVGIGIATPLSTFHVNDTGPAAVFGTTLANTLRIYPDVEPAMIWDVSTNLRFGTMTAINAGFSEKFRIQTNGNVGIGSQNPGAPLHVNATIGGVTALSNARQNATAFFRGSNGSWGVAIGSLTTNTSGYIQAMDESQGTANELILNPFGGGRVAINTTNPTTACNAGATLCVNGTLYVQTAQITSDARWKRDIQNIPVVWQSFMSLTPSSYSWRRHEFKDMNFGEGRQFGFIAQNVERSYPDLVSTNGKGFKSLNYSGLIAINTAAIQELKREKDNQILTLQSENEKLRLALTEKEKNLRTELNRESAARQRQELRLAQLEQSLFSLAKRLEDHGKVIARK